MSLESQVIELFKRGDPAQGVPNADAPLVDADLFLESLQPGGIARHDDHAPRVVRHPGWLVAAVVGGVLGLVFWLSSLADDELPPATIPPVSTTSAVAPSTSGVDGWDSIPFGIAGQGGEFRTNTFAVPFKLDLPPAWVRKHDEEPTAFSLGPSRECTEIRGPDRDCAGEFYVFLSPDDVETTVDVVAGLDGARASPTVAVSIGGAEGLTLDMTTTGDQPFIAEPDGQDWASLIVLPADLLRVYVVDVGGQTVVFQALALDTPAFVNDADAVIQTLEWRDFLP